MKSLARPCSSSTLENAGFDKNAEKSTAMTIDEIVNDYIRVFRNGRREEMRWFKKTRRLEDVVQRAALCVAPDGKRHPHQWRRQRKTRDLSAKRLRSCVEQLRTARDFVALHSMVEQKIGALRDVGPLMVYDVAYRIGVRLGKVPELVYLHAGAKAGATILGLRGKTIRPDELPSPFSRLTPAECEDCLCIYKDPLRVGTRTVPLNRAHCRRSSIPSSFLSSMACPTAPAVSASATLYPVTPPLPSPASWAKRFCSRRPKKIRSQ